MKLDSLITAAENADFRPLYDSATEELKEIVGDVARVASCKPRILPPGNDQHSHVLEWQSSKHVYKLYVRFDRRICSAVIYQRLGSARSFLTGDAATDPVSRNAIAALTARGFEYVGFAEAQVDLGPRPLEQGHAANTLFAYWFEDP